MDDNLGSYDKLKGNLTTHQSLYNNTQPMKILVTGATGFVGYHLVNYLREYGHDVIGICHRKSDDSDCISAELTDSDSITNLHDKYRPNVIIHLAAMARTDTCEKYLDESYESNVTITKNLVNAFWDAKFVFFSTYAVYNNSEGNSVESSALSPTNQYIYTKIEAEKQVYLHKNHIIFRPSVIYGYMPKQTTSDNYFMQLIKLLEAKKVLNSPNDQYFNPIYVKVVCEIIRLAIEKDINGIYNLGSPDSLSKYEFNKRIINQFCFDKNCLKIAVPTDNDVIRPSNGTISSEKIENTLSINIPSVDEMIRSLHDEVSGVERIKELKHD